MCEATLIGGGSFGDIYAIPASPGTVIKVVQSSTDAQQIKEEFYSFQTIYNACIHDSIFSIPRALAFHHPSTSESILSTLSVHIDHNLQYYAPYFTLDALPGNALYLMDRISGINVTLGSVIRQEFYPRTLEGLPITDCTPLLCRIYLGKEQDARRTRFINTNNYPLIQPHYEHLTKVLQQHHYQLPSTEKVASGMGQMLSRIHWKGGYDARDVEFVLGGSPLDDSVQLFILDFNQMRPFDIAQGDVTQLVDSFMTNDPYFPRPGGKYYATFKEEYIASCPMNLVARAESFLAALESRYLEQILQA